MTEAELENLQIGDTVRNLGSGTAYTVISPVGWSPKRRWLAIRTIEVSRADEWEKVPRIRQRTYGMGFKVEAPLNPPPKSTSSAT